MIITGKEKVKWLLTKALFYRKATACDNIPKVNAVDFQMDLEQQEI